MPDSRTESNASEAVYQCREAKVSNMHVRYCRCGRTSSAQHSSAGCQKSFVIGPTAESSLESQQRVAATVAALPMPTVSDVD